MREIKFRAWDKLDKKFLWPYPEGFNLFGEVTCFDLVTQQLSESKHDRKTTLERINDIEVMQYTGLKDKNGKEIYEGDIVKEILFDKQYTYLIESINSIHVCHWIIDIDKCNDIMKNIEIIGNIYENPELKDYKNE